MTNIEQKALELVNEVSKVETCWFSRDVSPLHEALCRAIERNERFCQEVSYAVEKHQAGMYLKDTELDRFIIAKPDPLVEALGEICIATEEYPVTEYAKRICAALAKHGGRIVFDD